MTREGPLPKAYDPVVDMALRSLLAKYGDLPGMVLFEAAQDFAERLWHAGWLADRPERTGPFATRQFTLEECRTLFALLDVACADLTPAKPRLERGAGAIEAARRRDRLADYNSLRTLFAEAVFELERAPDE